MESSSSGDSDSDSDSGMAVGPWEDHSEQIIAGWRTGVPLRLHVAFSAAEIVVAVRTMPLDVLFSAALPGDGSGILLLWLYPNPCCVPGGSGGSRRMMGAPPPG